MVDLGMTSAQGVDRAPEDYRDPRLPFPVRALVAAICLHSVINSLSVFTTAGEVVTFGIVIAAAAISAATFYIRERTLRLPSKALALWGIVLLLSIGQYPIRPDTTSSPDMFSDLAIASLPILMTAALCSWVRDVDRMFNVLVPIVFVGVAAAMIAMLRTSADPRFESPSIVAIVGSWILVVCPFPAARLKAERGANPGSGGVVRLNTGSSRSCFTVADSGGGLDGGRSHCANSVDGNQTSKACNADCGWPRVC